MSVTAAETRSMLVESASRMLAQVMNRDTIAAAEKGQLPAVMWRAAVDMGLGSAARSEARGGAGGIDPRALCDVLRIVAAQSAPLPLAETWLAERMLAAAGLPPADDATAPATIGPVVSGARPGIARAARGWTLSGTLHRVPWARCASSLAILADSAEGSRTVRIKGPLEVRAGKNYANEPRDSVVLDGITVGDEAVAAAGAGYGFDDVICDGALFRGAQMAGALERVLDMTVQYAKERIQFGRPIGKFQAVQQQIAVLAGHVAAASAAAHGAADARCQGPARFEIACAKTRIGEAAGHVAAIAHQVHGAMGFTHEHALQLSTRRLWSWRDEFGSEAEWSGWIGRIAARVGGGGLWALLTDPGGPETRLALWQGRDDGKC